MCLYNRCMITEITNDNYTTQEKLQILADAAKYDVACTSSGSSRRGKKGELGNAEACGICHSFAADGRCISLLKILMTNHCAYDCKYCINRASNDVRRATFTPQEICELTVEFYKRNYIEGLFLSSGVLKNPTYTMEKQFPGPLTSCLPRPDIWQTASVSIWNFRQKQLCVLLPPIKPCRIS